MGMSTGNNKGGVQSDINVTPLIDVLLVLLIIFLVVMPIMMKMETLQVPRKLDDQNEMPDPNSSMLTIKVKKDLSVAFNDGSSENDTPIQAGFLCGFYDDAVHELLALSDERWQSLYHFSMGVPVEDTRLTTEPGYP